MIFLQTYAKELFSLFVPLFTWGINRFFKAKAKLVLGNPHRFTYLVQQPLINPQGEVISPTQKVETTSFHLKNDGAETAKGVELVFNWKPACLNIWPSRHMTEHIESDNRYVLMFDNLAPDEVIGCELLAVNSGLPELIIARCEQCVAQPINMYPQPIAKPWMSRVIIFLGLLGLGTVVYFVLLLLQFLILKTPFGR